ncbi:MerR family transcriptional regulator [Isoptericola halotolerans]|uniref:DNA-binding transcriptional MerR regulator n=1 Tax=Isoptericola halotolerans TaxID=300560 RepID=A0ABX2AA17_9MICO|nr:MerR family transcriptional regulator [Isoptericola halotolerans]NOV98958.1 DNA-binding transcriptional MerR regulator [Isoptericola halotolerans]
MRIGEASRASGVSVRSLRFYEGEGLIVPGRCSNGYRDYCPSTLERVRVIRSLLASGLSVRLIMTLLSRPGDDPGVDPELPSAEFLAEVRRYRDRLDDRITALVARRSALEGFLARARDGRR